MYDSLLNKLGKDLETLEGKILAALADGKNTEHDSLLKEKKLLVKQIGARQQIVNKEAENQNKSKQNSSNQVLSERLEHSRKQLAELNCVGEKVEVFQGFGIKGLEFTYEELLQKINEILKRKKSFTVGNQYDGELTVTRSGIFNKTTKFVYHYYNRDKQDFVLKVSNMENFSTFMKSLTLVSCSSDPEIEHGVGHPIPESNYLYYGESIIRDLFYSFAKALYKPKD